MLLFCEVKDIFFGFFDSVLISTVITFNAQLLLMSRFKGPILMRDDFQGEACESVAGNWVILQYSESRVLPVDVIEVGLTGS